MQYSIHACNEVNGSKIDINVHYLLAVKKFNPPAAGMFNRLSARWNTSPLKKSLLAILVPGRDGNSDVVAVAGVMGMLVVVGGADVGTVAWAAGPRAADNGVAGRGDAIGDTPCRNGGNVEAVEVGSEAAELGPLKG